MSKLLSLLVIIIFIRSSHAMNRCCKPTNNVEALDLGNAASFTILTKTGITDVPTSNIDGNVGCYPITGAAILLTCAEVKGIIYKTDANGDACFVTDSVFLLAAIGDMATAFTTANSYTNYDFVELYAGDLSGQTLIHGIYKWSTNVLINADIYLSGSPTDFWIFQIAGNIVQAVGIQMILLGGAKAKNIFWVVAGPSVDVGAGALFQGSILSYGGIYLKTGATVNGRLLAQTAVTLQMNTIGFPSS